MKIQLVGFRSHVESTFSFEDQKITLLKGPSGIGKSTIFQAILWCLYGGMQHVYNNTGATNKCQVTLWLGPYVIYRQKRPELLKLLHTETKRETQDEGAQKIIDSYFGPKELWLACSYIQQGSRCSLLTIPNSEKMDILSHLSFNIDDPEVFINTIDQHLNNITAQFEMEQKIFTHECEQFAREIQNAQLDLTKKCTSGELELQKAHLEGLYTLSQKLGGEVLQYQNLSGRYQVMVQEQTRVKAQWEEGKIIYAL